MLKCLIVDDEPSARKILSSYVDKTPFLELAAESEDPIEAMTYLQENQVDLIFLDIQMPHLSGIEFMQSIDKNTMVILTTAFSDYAIEGFDNEAVDYLLKPIPFDRFLKAANKAKRYKEALYTDKQEPVEEDKNFLFVKTESKGKMIKINYPDMLYVEGLKNYVSIYTKEERIITYATIKDMQAKLPPHFIRVHKSYIVNMQQVNAMDGNQLFLNDMKAQVPVGETYKSNLFEYMENNTMGGKR